MDHFYEKLAEILEADTVNGSDVLADFPEWDSLSVLSAIAMIGSTYGVILVAADVKSVTTAQGLRDLVAAKAPSSLITK
jgi:acyl carrier protein